MMPLTPKWWYTSFFLIVCLATLLRFVRLDSVPPSLNWDEVAIGWNAKSMRELRLDEYGTRLPLAFKSFGDYKAPFYIYGLSPLVGFLGLHAWVVRLPSALAGVVAVATIGLITWELDRLRKPERQRLTRRKLWVMLAMFLMATSPWHLQFSRGAFEANVALTLVLIGTWMFLKGLNSQKTNASTYSSLLWWLIAGLWFILASYTYHSPKVFLPFFLLGSGGIYGRWLGESVKKRWLLWIGVLLLWAVAAWPILQLHLYGEGATRLSGTSIFYTAEEKPRALDWALVRDLGTHYWAHLSPAFYTQSSTTNFRIGLAQYGLMPWAFYLSFGVGLIVLGYKIWSQTYLQERRMALFLWGWFLLGLLPAAIGREVPHSLRSLNALPAIMLISSWGLVWLWGWFWKVTRRVEWGRAIRLWGLGLVILWGSWDYGRYLQEYWVKYPVYAAADWQYGYAQVAQLAQTYENQVEKIVITSAYGQPYIFTLFYQDRNPQLVLWGAMSRYLYRTIQWDGDQFLQNTLLIGTPEEIPLNFPKERGELIKEIYYPDGGVAFRVVKTRATN